MGVRVVEIPKCQIQKFKESFWYFEMTLNKVKQLVSEPHELFFLSLPSKWLATRTGWVRDDLLVSRINRLQILLS